ncbi:hypothetical protein Cob_v010167 [Colletotrichum orbiculare MAFF 240422]|uniref:Uncharacterized protein n=1 Tax=Colletotrichum orbiculare (strain 104-T / ATCC 96160 / CBS 514.97 / LARS 414 / MAFF 240422) TaxID=1213857 RepID=A0A484FJ09_COLOR|nr:hypothetical protein Cob_v010167 [Colletotrichum orbiculare MAFF 240422]
MTLQSESDNYRSTLQYALHQIEGSSSSDRAAGHQSFLVDSSLLWKVPAFSRPTSFMLGKEWLLKRAEAIQALRRTRANAVINVDDIWAAQALSEWIACDESQIMVVQGCSQTVARLEHFGCELVRFLSDRTPTAFIIPWHSKSCRWSLLRDRASQPTNCFLS